MADDQLSGQTSTPIPMEPPSGGIVFQPDPDSKPVGRCYPEQLAAMAAVAAMRAAQQRVREAVSAFGDCRAQARAEAGDYAAANDMSFEAEVDKALLSIATSASIIEDVVKQACSDCSEDSEE